MHAASRRQITRMLDIFGETPEVTALDLGCLNHETDRMSFRKTWTAPQVRKALGWLAARNASGSSCFIRPARSIAETRWVLIDDLTVATLRRLTAAHVPNMVVQMAVDRLQAWLKLEEPVDVTTRIDVARFFTREIGGDPDTVNVEQFGRLPGTTDRTPSRVRRDLAPFVVLRAASSTVGIPIPPAVARPDGRGRTGGGAQGEVERGKEDIERSGDRDFAIACRLLEAGADDHTITATIAAVRGFDRKSAGGYIPRTIRAARRHLQTGRK